MQDENAYRKSATNCTARKRPQTKRNGWFTGGFAFCLFPVDIERIIQFSKILEIPVQEFLPETFSIHNNNTDNDNGQVGFIIGDFYYYGNESKIDHLLINNKENYYINLF